MVYCCSEANYGVTRVVLDLGEFRGEYPCYGLPLNPSLK